jgi:hypothetical protein
MSPGPDDGNPEDGKILSPEELDIADDEHVEELDEGRYVVSSNARGDTDPARPQQEPADQPEPQPEPDPEPEPAPEFSEANVHEWLHDRLDGSNSRYGFDVTAKFDGAVSQQQMASNDIVTVFESLMLWYARQIDSSTPVEEVLGILLSESSVPVRYPSESLQRLVRSTELTREDSIGDLLDAVEDHESTL